MEIDLQCSLNHIDHAADACPDSWLTRAIETSIDESRDSAETPLLIRHDELPHQVQVSQRKGSKGAGGVLGDPAIAHLGESPELFHDSECVLAASARSRSALVDLLLMLRQRPLRGPATVHPVAH